jgi:hypothetical protein
VTDRQIVDPELMLLMARLWNSGVGTDLIARSIRANEAWVYNRIDTIKRWAKRLRAEEAAKRKPTLGTP